METGGAAFGQGGVSRNQRASPDIGLGIGAARKPDTPRTAPCGRREGGWNANSLNGKKEGGGAYFSGPGSVYALRSEKQDATVLGARSDGSDRERGKLGGNSITEPGVKTTGR